MKITLIIIGVTLALIAIVFIYYGGLKKVTCRVEKQGGETLVYKQMTGDYAKSAKLMDEIYYSLIKDYGIETFKGFGIYYDNPKEIDKSKLRSEIGCIIEEKDSSKVAQLKEDLKIKTFPEKSYIIAEFASKGKLSIVFGLMKVYPAMDKFVKENGYKKEGAVMEIYDVPNKKIVYRKEIIE
ncbi:GyrI-like small molecule binding domain-containing protein [Mariniphaga anaerophila]|uniref:GyrI-like small molecule binding domain-containing protein n=1 Tax=Mariniphaga anaerophila TaxID=1484053 RepID=A0A1M5GR30_9BACT|nr:GyrI-like domain-containing protein [Mariniphaga anaerophila]SHG05932.1 GyrI-like small molecule binding domain-containing protein [Mariniphaga anaerophila]